MCIRDSTYSALGQAFVDVFSCKPYDTSRVEGVMRRYFGEFEVVEQTTLGRGVHWGSNVEREMESWVAAREENPAPALQPAGAFG